MNLQQTLDLQAGTPVKKDTGEPAVPPFATSKVASTYGYKHEKNIAHGGVEMEVYKDKKGNKMHVHKGTGNWQHADDKGNFIKKGSGGEELHGHLKTFHPIEEAEEKDVED